MVVNRLNRYQVLAFVILVLAIMVGGVIIWLKLGSSQPVEISLPPSPELQGTIYVGGNVTFPGYYPFKNGDNIATLLQAAGGATASGNLSNLKLYVANAEEGESSQKININRADMWLLEALPGIGETLAGRIVDYRQQKGPFLNTRELLKVAGMGTGTFEQIESLITVED